MRLDSPQQKYCNWVGAPGPDWPSWTDFQIAINLKQWRDVPLIKLVKPKQVLDNSVFQ